MTEEKNQKILEQNIPGMRNRSGRFAEVEHAENVKAPLAKS